VQTDATLERIVGLARRALKLSWLWLCGPTGEVLAGARPLELPVGGPEFGKLYPLEHPDWGKLGELGLSNDLLPVSDLPHFNVPNVNVPHLNEAEILELRALLTEVLAQQQACLWSIGTLEHSPQPSFSTDLEGRVRCFNPAALALFRLSAEEVVGQLFERIPALSSPRLDVAFSQACSGAEVRPLELPCFRSDGTVALLRFSLAPLLDAAQRLRGVVFCADDLLASLEDSGERETLRRLYAEVLDHLPLQLILLDGNERVMYLNPTVVPDLKLRRSFQGVHWEKVSRAVGLSEVVLEDWRKRIKRVRQTRVRVEGEETVETRKGKRHFLHCLQPVLSARNEIEMFIGYSLDLTQQRRAQLEREEALLLFKGLFEHATEGIYRLDAAGQLLWANPALLRFNGCSSEAQLRESMGENPGSWYVQPERFAEFMGLLETDLGVVGFESEVQLTLSGERRWITESARSVRDAAGQRLYIEGTIQDITARKLAELEREEALTMYRSLFENATEGIYQTGPDGVMVRANPALVRANNGHSETEFLKEVRLRREEWYVLPGQREAFDTALARYGRVDALESEVIPHHSSERRWVSESAWAVRDESGRTLYYQGFIQDITARKLAETQLEGEKRLLEQVFEASPNPIFVRDTSGQLVLVNAKLLQVSNTSAADFWAGIGSRHPDNAAEFAQWLENDRIMLAQGEAMTFEEKFTRTDGQVIVYSTVKAPLLREDGTVQVLGISTDITEMRRNTERLSFIERAVEASSDSISISNAHGEVIYLNAAAQRHFGYTLEHLMQHTKNGTELIPPEIIPHVRRAFAQNEPFQGETTVLGARGVEIQVLMRLDQMRGAQGEEIGVVAVVTDITERKRMEDELRLIRMAFESSSDAILITDEEFRPLFINPASKAQTGYGIEALKAGALGRLSSSELGLQIIRTLTETDVYFGEGEVQHLEGRSIPVLMRGNRIRGSSGQVLGSVMVATDISERRRIERLKDEFVATVSHELRTPLTSISGALGLLVAGVLGDVSEEQRPMLDIAHQNAERLIALVGDLLDMQKMEGEGLSLSLKPLELRAVLEQAAAEMAPYAHNLGVSLVLELGNTPQNVRGDFGRLAQVVTNLLSNACKFSSAGGNVNVRTLERANTVRVEVEDRGTGIPKAFRGQIFGKFAQADASSTRSKGGTGLGLAISRAIVERHGGQIGFEPLEVGTLFYFELPLLEG